MNNATRRIAIIGAGPIGLEAALALQNDGHDVHIYERGQIADSVRQWSHVTLFSTWELNASPLGIKTLEEQGLEPPPKNCFPTGAEYIERYLEPLARHPGLKDRIHTDCQVLSITRKGVLKGELIASAKRSAQPFRLHLRTKAGDERYAYADVVLDTSGTYGNPNALGDGGTLALGEQKAAEQGRIVYTIPDVLGSERTTFAGKHTLLVGAGYSAVTALRDLSMLAEQAENTCVTWLTRGGQQPYTVLPDDPLPQRDQLAKFGNALAGSSKDGLQHVGHSTIERIEIADDGGLHVHIDGADGARVLSGIDTIVANIGYRPDLSLFRELQVHQCYASEGPMKLAAALLSASGGGGDCLQQTSMGADTLKSPEPDFYVLGSKSYGRGSAFLLKLGLEQISDVRGLIG